MLLIFEHAMHFMFVGGWGWGRAFEEACQSEIYTPSYKIAFYIITRVLYTMHLYFCCDNFLYVLFCVSAMFFILYLLFCTNAPRDYEDLSGVEASL